MDQRGFSMSGVLAEGQGGAGSLGGSRMVSVALSEIEVSLGWPP